MATPNADETKTAHELSMSLFFTAMAYGAAYITAATAIIMLNKYMLSVTAFKYPIVLSSLGVVCGWLTSIFMVYTKRVDMANHKDITFKFWAQNVLPIGFFQGTTLMLGCVTRERGARGARCDTSCVNVFLVYTNAVVLY